MTSLVVFYQVVKPDFEKDLNWPEISVMQKHHGVCHYNLVQIVQLHLCGNSKMILSPQQHQEGTS